MTGSRSSESSPTSSFTGGASNGGGGNGSNGRAGRSVPRTRILGRGQIFEASKRMESAGNVASLYTTGRGLVKLADGSGWAIVPYEEDLAAQFRAYRGSSSNSSNGGNAGGGGGNNNGGAEVESATAYEEIGNAIIALAPSASSSGSAYHQYPSSSSGRQSRRKETIVTTRRSSDDDVVWLRITPPSGVKVMFPPPPPQINTSHHERRSAEKAASPDSYTGGSYTSRTHISSNDSEVASSVGSSFFDAVLSRVTPTKYRDRGGSEVGSAGATSSVAFGSDVRTKIQQPLPRYQHLQPPRGSPTNHHHHGTVDRGGATTPPQSYPAPILSCGMVVPVEIWEGRESSSGADDEDSKDKSSKRFVRLFNGQGWIPHCLGNVSYVTEVSAPDLRLGSFWFRVQSTEGSEVHHGPSRSAPTIRSEDGVSFRFECGEFLRASEIVTVFPAAATEDDNDFQDNAAECYAKLYRKHRGYPSSNGSSQGQIWSDRYSSLSSFALPGEWVQVHGHGNLYLEECSMAPTIERLREGWRYSAVVSTSDHNHRREIRVHQGPSFRAEPTGQTLRPGESFLVTEKVIAFGDRNTWLRLKGDGWVHVREEESGEIVVQPHHQSLPRKQLGRTSSTEAEYSKIAVSRLLGNNGSVAVRSSMHR